MILLFLVNLRIQNEEENLLQIKYVWFSVNYYVEKL